MECTADLSAWTRGKMRSVAICMDGHTDNLLQAMKTGSYICAAMTVSGLNSSNHQRLIPSAAVANITLADALRYSNSLGTKDLIYIRGDSVRVYRNTDRALASEKKGLQLLAEIHGADGVQQAQYFINPYVRLDLVAAITAVQRRMPDQYNEQALRDSMNESLDEGARWRLRHNEIYRT